jgi:hypothetical protein
VKDFAVRNVEWFHSKSTMMRMRRIKPEARPMEENAITVDEEGDAEDVG